MNLPSVMFTPYMIAINMLVEQLILSGKFRTTIILHEFKTASVASNILASDTNRKVAWISINIELENINRKHDNISWTVFGPNGLAIYAVDNLDTFDRFNVTHNRFPWDKRVKCLVILQNEPKTYNQLDTFIKSKFKIFTKSMAVIYWNHLENKTELYNFNLNRNASERAQVMNDLKKNEITEIVFPDNAKNFNGSKLSVFMVADPPKIIRMPQKYIKGNTFHFCGRDGLIAKCLAYQLNARFHYVSIDVNVIIKFPIDELCPTLNHLNMFGETISPDKQCTPNNLILLPVNKSWTRFIIFILTITVLSIGLYHYTAIL